jgi:flagellar biogenesis protein FliO
MISIGIFNFGSLRRAAWVRPFLMAAVALTLVGMTSLSGEAATSPSPLATNAVPTVGLPPSPSLVLPLVRMAGALALVMALVFGAQWFLRHGRKLGLARGGAPRLNVVEVKSLGHRHALYVIGYERQRMLVATSPAGVSLLSQLPDSEGVTAEPNQAPLVSFADALMQTLGRK